MDKKTPRELLAQYAKEFDRGYRTEEERQAYLTAIEDMIDAMRGTSGQNWSGIIDHIKRIWEGE